MLEVTKVDWSVTADPIRESERGGGKVRRHGTQDCAVRFLELGFDLNKLRMEKDACLQRIKGKKHNWFK